jgi:hypothetical protein
LRRPHASQSPERRFDAPKTACTEGSFFHTLIVPGAADRMSPCD